VRSTVGALLFVIATPLFAQAAAPLRIGKVTVSTLDVYTPVEASRGFLYRTADRLHIETHRGVIEKFLLFHEGDEYHPERLAETERNLRALRFLKSASVTASAPHDGVVDVAVTTQDAWSIAPETQAGRGGGATAFGVNLTDTNILGLGKDLSIGWDRNSDRTSRAIAYNDPAFFGSYWNGRFAYASNSDGYDHRVSISRPFYSFATPWALNVTFNNVLRQDRLFTDGTETERFRQHHRVFSASYGAALDPNDYDAPRLSGGVRFVTDDFSTLTNLRTSGLPALRHFHYLFVRLDRVENDFLKLDFVNKDMRYEDFNLGRQLSLETAVSPGPSSTTGFARATAARGWRVGQDGFVMPGGTIESRFAGGFQNAIASSSVQFVHRNDETPHPRAFVARVAATSSWRSDDDVQVAVDGMNGLRGYRLHSFTGTRAFVINVEERLFVGRELLQLVSPGVVVFADAGNATNEGLSNLLALKSDVGFGFRMGLPRTPKNLLRLDFAYALNRDPLGRRGWLVSFASGQAF